MKALFRAIVEALKDTRPLIMVSVIASSGSTPRGPGATMLVFEDGHAVGTIGGGTVEHAAQKYALGLFCSQGSAAKGYNLSSSDVSDLGMVCGGAVTVYFQYLNPQDKQTVALFEEALRLVEQDENVWMLRKIQNGQVAAMGLYCDGMLGFSDCINSEELAPLLKSHAVLTKGDPAFFVEPISRREIVYVFGGGHVSQELVPALARIGFQVVVFEERESFANPALFPDAKGTVLGSFSSINDRVNICKTDYIIIMTRGHQSDYEVLRQVLRSGATYIGCIGSRHKIAATLRCLLDDGFSEEEFARVHTPIGLEILAVTPAEIAVSIAAEMILHRAQQRET